MQTATDVNRDTTLHSDRDPMLPSYNCLKAQGILPMQPKPATLSRWGRPSAINREGKSSPWLSNNRTRRSHAGIARLALLTLACATQVFVTRPCTAMANDTVLYNRDVRPILADKCFACHGFDEKTREAGLRLDTSDGATADHDGARAITPGDVATSEAWTRIHTSDPSLRMPPESSHKSLSPEEIDILRRWIEQGAEYQKHWAFEGPVQPNLPTSSSDSLNPIDAFLDERLQRQGRTLAPQASKPILIRRVAFALTGLPPTTSEVDAFLADDSANAYENMVDRYLRSQHYGEEMARHWLDVARYADTHGLHLDNERQMWAYRDWVVQSFNRNQPFDQFTIEQLAGDLLPNPSTDQLIATGFNRCNVTTSEGGSIDSEFYYRYAVDRTSTMASTWMALTAGCAVCHDHKFDPISTKEFYSLYAFFNASADPAMDGNALLTNPVLKLETEDDRRKMAALDASIGGIEQTLREAASRFDYRDPASLEPKPEPKVVESVWLEDAFPTGGNIVGGPGQPTLFVDAASNEPVFSGTKALKRTDAGLSQDVWQDATTPLLIPNQAKLFAYVYIDPKAIPKSIMLQYHKNGWLHRAVWGDYDAIQWGTAQTHERVSMGPLPTAGEWVRLEFAADAVGLNTGDALTGFATTQFGGTVTWDHLGVSGIVDIANDPQRSFLAWWKSIMGKDVPGLPGQLNATAKAGPEAPCQPEDREALLRHYLVRVCTDTQSHFTQWIREIDTLRTERDAVSNAIPSTFIYKDASTPRESFVMLRGQYNLPGDRVEASTPAVLPPIQRQNESDRLTRLDLARWLVAPDHPLTARVAVNRFWQQVFGVGLVKSSADFGTQGELPSHPELLDWLSLHFQATGWDVQQLMRLMVTSAAFRQSSSIPTELLERDPENRWLGRGPRLRLDAEQLRDNALFMSGLIDLRLGGKGVKPYQPSNIWEPVGFAGSNTRFYQQDRGNALYRRSLYTFYKRTAPPPFMVNFDAPNREQSCTRRERSNTPLQALQLLNDVQHVEAARGLAQRALREGPSDADGRLAWLFRTVLSRAPTMTELEITSKQLAQHLVRYQSDENDAKKLVELGESKPAADLSVPELAAYTLIAGTILNMDETLHRN
jgi:hypothetical protein